ncbi:tyrosine-type recombinase/integrase [Syntrophorhabdus aromaticivorans]|uniref:tyrosine-type recombinase/integrase n=1 Tax=Syntrophorhabdus aromaticivorans TaxID=328301 RepID=UPI0009FEF38B|nr:site-specific integrase [Syntrophorhabdus aromaticivorans]
MTLQEAIQIFKDHQKISVREKTRESYDYLFRNLGALLGEGEFTQISSQDLLEFLLLLTEGSAKSTARLRYAQLKAFFNFIIERTHTQMTNPCNDSLLSKTFRAPRMKQREIIGREVVDEIIYRCPKVRNRLILELQARCGMRIGEVLNLHASDVNGRRLTLRRPKSGREEESAFMPETVAARLKAYIEGRNLFAEDRIFPICYSTARSFVKRLGDTMKMKIRPHDLRRHSATYASRNGVPLEVISKVILRHQDLKTTQMYLGKISEVEALRWMDVLHGK